MMGTTTSISWIQSYICTSFNRKALRTVIRGLNNHIQGEMGPFDEKVR
jgi:hypothetical protein